MQTAHDLWHAERELAGELARIKPAARRDALPW
jgi:hypothetical protein